MERYYFVSYHIDDGGLTAVGDALAKTFADKGVLGLIKKNLSKDGTGKDVIVLNLCELSEDEYNRLCD